MGHQPPLHRRPLIAHSLVGLSTEADLIVAVVEEIGIVVAEVVGLSRTTKTISVPGAARVIALLETFVTSAEGTTIVTYRVVTRIFDRIGTVTSIAQGETHHYDLIRVTPWPAKTL